MLEDFQGHLQKEEDRRGDAEEELQRNSTIMVSVKAGVEHLTDKLYLLKAVSFYIRVYLLKSLFRCLINGIVKLWFQIVYAR